MKTMSKQMISFLLVILLCFSVLPVPALATAGETPTEEPQQTEELQQETNSGAPEGMESPAVESTPTPEPTPDPEPTPAPTPAPGSEGTEEPPVESESPDAQDEPQETPAPTEQEEELPPVDETEEALPVEENPELPELLPTEEPQPVSIGLDIEPISYAVVDEPLVTVTFHYTDAQVATPTNLPTSSISAHTYHPLTKLADNRMAIPANLFPDEIQVDTAALKVTLDGELDITAQAEYDAASGMMYLPARYWGHEIDVDWFCAYAEVASVTISANAGVNMGGAFQEKTHAMTLPSNADMIEIPLPEGRNAVVSQCGIDLPESAYSIEDGVLYVQASPLGGDITVTAYAAGSQRRMLARSASARPATVTHTRSADQIYYGYYTSYYTANGNPAFCLDPTVSGLNAGVYAIDYWLDDPNDFLVKCCYYLYGGPGYGSVKNIFEDPDALWAYGMCHAVASYAYMGSLDAFKGLDDTLTGQLVQVANIVRSLPAVPSGFECFVYNTGGNNQPLVGWQYTPASWEPDPEPEPEPDPTGSVAVQKSSSAPDMTEGNPCYSLEGAVFDVYSGSARVGSISTDVNGYGSLSGLPVGSGYYLVERTPPAGFAGTDQEYSFTIYENDTTTVAVSNIPQNDPTTIMVRKQDADTGKAEPQGGAGLSGAQFTVKYYKGSYTSASALNGATPARTWVLETDEDGFAMLHPDYLVNGDAFYYNSAGTIVTLPLGTVTIQETKAPEGYLISQKLSEDVKWGFRKSFAQGKVYFGGRFYGYRMAGEGKVEIIPEQAEIVKQIFQMYLDGSTSRKIAQTLTRRGVLNASGNIRWDSTTIDRMLANEKYMGDALSQKTFIADVLEKKPQKNTGQLPQYYVTDNHEAIIPREMFKRVQFERARRGSLEPKGTKTKTNAGRFRPQYVLTEILLCGECGEHYRRCTWARNGKKKVVWRCINRLENGKRNCRESPTLDEGVLHDAILGFLRNLQSPRDELVQNLLEYTEESLEQKTGDSKKQKLLDMLEQKNRLLQEMLSLDIVPDEKIEQLSREYDEIQEQIDSLGDVQNGMEQENAYIRGIKEYMETADFNRYEFDDKLIRQVIEQVIVKNADTLYIRMKGGYEAEIKLPNV